MTPREKERRRTGLLFISPWILGFLAFTAYPLLASLWFSLCDYSVLAEPVYIGAENYRELLQDEVFWLALRNTVLFAAAAIPLGTALAIGLAVLLNQPVRGRGLYRTIFFLPSLVPAISLAILWQWLLNGSVGLVNEVLQWPLRLVNAVAGT
ncbi:MAG: carbohydrate ABC transporter permease, partial [Sphaerospermopsis kisseleviana]